MTIPIIVRDLVIGAGAPKIIVPIVGKSLAEILREADNILRSKANLIEWRADFYEGIEDKDCVLNTLGKLRNTIGNTPLVFTVRTFHEGGQAKISDKEYYELLLETAKSNQVDLIDVELFRCAGRISQLIEEIHQSRTLAITSNHDFSLTPSLPELESRLQRMVEVGADILKIAVMPHSASDVLNLLTATVNAAEKYSQPLVTMSMGGLGVITRLTGEVFKSAMSFGTVGGSSAPGQLPIDQLDYCLNIIHEAYGE